MKQAPRVTNIGSRPAWRWHFCVVALLLCTSVAKGQPHFVLSTAGCYTVPNSEEWSYIADLGAGADVALQFPQAWCHLDDIGGVRPLRYPYNMGIRSNFTYFPNAIAGHRITQSLYLQEHLWGWERNNLMFEFDFGLAFYTNPYRRTPNPDNVFIGSYINCMIQVGLAYQHILHDNSALWLSAMFAHSSNGYLKKPNKGLNYLQLQLGYQLPHRLPDAEALERDCRLRIFDSLCYIYLPIRYHSAAFPRHDLVVSYAPGFVRPRSELMQDRFHYAYTARLGWQYHFNPVRAVGASLDITYNTTHDSLRVLDHDRYPLSFYAAIGLNYETTYNRLTLHLGLASYLLHSQQIRTPFYERVGLFYNFRSVDSPLRPFVGISLKAHSAHIDFIEWHVGCRFRMKT